MRERVEVQVDLFFMSSGMRSRVEFGWIFFINIDFLLIQGLTIKTGNSLKIGDLPTLWYNGKS